MAAYTHLLAIAALTVLCAGWVGVQFLARRAGTKNHFEHLGKGGCNGCSCGGGTCERND